MVDTVKNELDKTISESIKQTKNIFDEEIDLIVSMINEQFYDGINFLNEIKDSILSKIYSYVHVLIQNLIDIINDIKKSIINSSNDKKELINKKYEKFIKKITTLKEEFYDKIQSIINDMFGNFNLINAINEKIDIENIINKIEEIIEIIKRKSDNILNNIIPSIKNTISKYTKNGILDELMIKVENMTKIINSLSEKIMPIFKFIRENMNKLKEINLNEIVLDKINILFTKIDEIMKKADSLKNNYVDINENNTKEILKKTDILIDLIYNLEEWINEKIKNMLNKILTPIDKMIEYLMNLSNKIKDKIYEIKIELIQKFDISVENLKNSVNNLIDKLLDKGLDLLPNTSFDIGIPTLKENGTKILEISSNLIEKFKSLQNGMRNYEQNSQMDETIKILDDMIINELIRILLEALQDNKVSNFIKKGAEALLKEMDNLQKNLKEELKDIGGIE